MEKTHSYGVTVQTRGTYTPAPGAPLHLCNVDFPTSENIYEGESSKNKVNYNPLTACSYSYLNGVYRAHIHALGLGNAKFHF